MKFPRLVLRAGAGWALLSAATVQANVFFDLIPDAGTPQYVIDAFALAANRWSAVLADNFTVQIQIGYQTMSGGVLGQTQNSLFNENYATVVAALNATRTSADDASAYGRLQSGSTYTRIVNHTRDNPNGANSATPYSQSLTPVAMTRANAKALGLLTASGAPDAAIRFNSSLAFDFNPADGTTSGQFDFVTVAAHEIGHVLGFVSGVDQIEQSGGSLDAAQLPATILDLFRFSAQSLAMGAGVLDDCADTRDKFFSVDGGISGLLPFATGSLYGSGYQASHWKEFLWAGYLMDPATFPGTQRNVKPTELRAFDLLGYTLVGVPEPGTASLLVLFAATVGVFRRGRQ